MPQHLVQAKKMEAVGEVTGAMAHDFNNLFTVIIGSLEMLEAEVTANAKAHTLATLALKGTAKAADLTRHLLAFSGRQQLDPQVVSLDELVSGSTQRLRQTLGEQIQIKAILADDLWPMFADPAQVQSSLLHLTINAREAMPSGGSLTIETANATLDKRYAAENPEVAPGDYVMMALSDTGTGMSAEVLERVFEPFFTTKRDSKGTGFGLSVVYGFAKQSGGHIKIESIVGRGTTVRVYLPRATAELVESNDALSDVHVAVKTAMIPKAESHPKARTVAAARRNTKRSSRRAPYRKT